MKFDMNHEHWKNDVKTIAIGIFIGGVIATPVGLMIIFFLPEFFR